MNQILKGFILLVIFSMILVQPVMMSNKEIPKTALLLIDIQDFYFPGGALPLVSPEAASVNAGKILKKFRLEKKLIIHVGHKTKKGMEFHQNVKPVEGEKVIIKEEV